MKSIGIIIVTATTIVFSGFVSAQIWNWFVAITFNIPKIDVLNAIGINILISYYTPPTSQQRQWNEAIFMALARSGIALLFAFIVAVLMGRVS